MSEQVELLLKQLRLPTFIRYYHEIWQEASDQGWSHPEYLMYLCEKEVADRYQRRIKTG